MTRDATDIEGLFPAADEAAWRAVVDKALKGRPFDTLRTRTEDGATLEPLYPKEEAPVPIGRPSILIPVEVVTRLDLPAPADAAAQSAADLEDWVSGHTVVLPSAPTAWGAGVEAFDRDALDAVLGGVSLDTATVRLEGGGCGRGLLALFTALLERRGTDPHGVTLHAGLDPLGTFAAAGKLSAPAAEVGRRLADTERALSAAGFGARGLSATGFGGTTALADGRPFHAAGARDSTELAVVLANALFALRAFDDGGLDLAAASRRIGFALAIDQDQFGGIAKIRALRRLWAAVRRDCALPPDPAHIHAETAWRMMAARDPYTNILRTTIAAFAAVVGGADSVTVLPFTQAIGVPGPFARRIARNTQGILLQESHLAAVVDPASGSGAVAARTDALCGAAWDVFRDIEKRGGLAAAIADGSLAARIGEERAERARAFATRARTIIGTSNYPHLEERPVTAAPFPSPRPAERRGVPVRDAGEGTGEGFRALVAAAAEGASLADLGAAAAGAGSTVPPLERARLSAPFEVLRDAADAARAGGVEPVVFLATLGPLPKHAPRADWTANLLAAGGVRTERGGPLEDPEAAAAAFAAHPARIACLCGDDDTYAARAADTTRALLAAGADAVYLAGKPADAARADLAAAGVTRFLHVGIDVTAALAAVHADLGIAPVAG